MRQTSRDKTPTFDTTTEQHLVGQSLSLCIRDIIEGRVSVEQVDYIVTRTCLTTPEHWDEVLTQYRSWYWEADPDRAERITRNLLLMGKLDQPRTRGEWPAPYDYHWRKA